MRATHRRRSAMAAHMRGDMSMIETLFGSAPPLWTAIPSTAFSFQPATTMGARPINGPMVGMAPLGGPMTAAQGMLPEPLTGPTPAQLLGAVALRRGQQQPPATDQEIEELMFDAFDVLGGAADVEVRSDSGRVTLTGSVPHRRIKRDVGELAWAIPAVVDVQNNVTIASRRRTRMGAREAESSPVPARKQA